MIPNWLQAVVDFFKDNGVLFASLAAAAAVATAVIKGWSHIVRWVGRLTHKRPVKPVSAFPFIVITSPEQLRSELWPNVQHQVLPHRGIEYIPGRAAGLDQIFERHERVIIRGTSQAGKTREMAELVARHWQEGMTVLLLDRHARLEPPFAVPRDLPYRNIVLLINDVDHYCTSTAPQEQTSHLASETGQERRQELSSTEPRHFKHRLQEAIKYFEHMAGAEEEVRVVATVRKDELSWNAIQFDKAELPWKTFKVFNLDDVPQRTAGALIQWLAKETDIQVPDDIRSALASKNAGTFTNLILAFRDWKLAGVRVLGSEHLAEFEGSLSDTFYLRYKRAVDANPLNQYLYAALDILRTLNIAPHRYLVAELATRMAGDRPVLATRRVQSFLRHSFERTEDTITHSNFARAITARFPKLGSRLARGFTQAAETRLGRALGRYLRYGSETNFSKAGGGSKAIQKALQQLTETEIAIDGDILEPTDGQVDGCGIEWMDSETVAGLLTEHASADDSFIYSLISLAERLAEDHDYQTALPLLDKAIQLAPRYPYARRKRAWIRRVLRRYDDALADADVWLELDPRDYAAFAHKAMTLHQLKRNDEAILVIDKAISLVPSSAWLYELKGDILRDQGSLPQAHAAYDTALNLDPKRCWTYGAKAIALRNEDKHDEALKLLDKGIAIKPTDDWLWAQRGVTLREMDRYADGLASFDKAIALDPKIAWYHGHRAIALSDLGRDDDALTAFDQAIALDPQTAWVHARRGITLSDLERYDGALAAFDQAIGLGPTVAWFHGQRGRTLRDMERYDDALAAFDQAIALDPKEAWAHMARSTAYRKLGQVEPSLSDINRALEIKPKDDWLVYRRAEVFLTAKQMAQAQADLAEAIRLAEVRYGVQPTDWQNTFNLALYRLANNEAAEAERLYRAGIAGNARPNHIRDAIYDLDDLATVFTDSEDVRAMRALLAVAQPSVQNGGKG